MSNYQQSTQKKFINITENKHYLGYNPSKPCLTDRGAPYNGVKGNSSLTYTSVTPSRERSGMAEQNKYGINNFLSPRSDNYQNMHQNGNQKFTNGTNLSSNNGYFLNQSVKQSGYRTVLQEDFQHPANSTYNYSNNPITHQNFNMQSRSTTNITPNKSNENIHIDRSLENSLERTQVVNDKQGDDVKMMYQKSQDIHQKYIQEKQMQQKQKEKKNGNNMKPAHQEILNKLKQLQNNANGIDKAANLNYSSNHHQNFNPIQVANQQLNISNNNNPNNQILNINQSNNILSKQQYANQSQQNHSSQQNLLSNINKNLNNQVIQNNTNPKRSITPSGVVSSNNALNSGQNKIQLQELLNKTQLNSNLSPMQYQNINQSSNNIQQQTNDGIQKVSSHNNLIGQQRQSVPSIQNLYQQMLINSQQQTQQLNQNKQQGNMNLDRRYTPSYIPQDSFNQINDQQNFKQNGQQNFIQNNIQNYSSAQQNKNQQSQIQEQTILKRQTNTQATSKSSNNQSSGNNQSLFKQFNNNQQRISSPNINNNNSQLSNQQMNMMIRNFQQNNDNCNELLSHAMAMTGDENQNGFGNNFDQNGQYLSNPNEMISNNEYIQNQGKSTSTNQLSKNASSNQILNTNENNISNKNNHAYTNSSKVNSYNESQNDLSQDNLNKYLVNVGGVNSQNNLSRDNQSKGGIFNGQNSNNITNNGTKFEQQQKYVMKLLLEKQGDKYNQQLINTNQYQNNQTQQIYNKQHHSQMSPEQLLQQQLQQQLDSGQIQENETPRKVNKSVPIATAANQAGGQHLKISDIMKEQNKKNINLNNSRNGGLQKQLIDSILQNNFDNTISRTRSSTPNQLLKQQQQIFQSSNQFENEIQQIWLQQQQQQIPDQISAYQMQGHPQMNFQYHQNTQSSINPLVDFQDTDDFESNGGSKNYMSQNKLLQQQDITQMQQQNDQLFSSSDLNQEQQMPQVLLTTNFSQNQETLDTDEFQNFMQPPNIVYDQQYLQFNDDKQQLELLQKQQLLLQQQQQLNQFQKRNQLITNNQQQQQIHLIQQQQQYQQQQMHYLNQQNYLNAQQSNIQQQIQSNQLKPQTNIINGGSVVQNNTNQLLQMANQQKIQQQHQILQQNLLLQQQQSNQQQLKQIPNSKNSTNYEQQQQQQQIQTNNFVNNQTNIQNEQFVQVGQDNNNADIQTRNQHDSISSSSSTNTQSNINNGLNSEGKLNRQQQQQQTQQYAANQQVISQAENIKVDLQTLNKIHITSIQVEEIIFELLKNREFEHQAKYLIKYQQIIQDLAILQNLPVIKSSMKEIQRSINMQIVLIQIIIYEHIVVIKQLRESVRGAISMNENLQNVLNSFQYVHSSFILILIIFEQAIQNIKDQGDSNVAQFDLITINNLIKERTKKRKMGFLIKNADKICILKKFNDILQPLIQILIEGQIELQEENRGFHTLYEDLYQIQENIPNLQISNIIDFSEKLSYENIHFIKDEMRRLSIIQERKMNEKQFDNNIQISDDDIDNSSSKNKTNSQNNSSNNQSKQESDRNQQSKAQNQTQNNSSENKTTQNKKDESADEKNRQEKDIKQNDNDERDLKNTSQNSNNEQNKSENEDDQSSSHPEYSIIGTVQSPYLKDSPKKPYTLVLDLDETLVHYQESDCLLHQQLQQLEDGGQFLVRPYAEAFLEEMSEYYEIIIFTAALQDYADFILDIIDVKKQIAYKLYRQHTVSYQNSYIKDLSRIGRDMNKTIIIDNLPENFKLQPENGIYIQSWYGEPEDRALYDLTPLLKQIVKKKFRTVQSALMQFREKIIQNLNKGIQEPHLNLSLEVFSGDEEEK